MSDIPNIISNQAKIIRLTWLDEPRHLDAEDYHHNPAYSDEECTQLIYNYTESDEGLRKRVHEVLHQRSCCCGYVPIVRIEFNPICPTCHGNL